MKNRETSKKLVELDAEEKCEMVMFSVCRIGKMPL